MSIFGIIEMQQKERKIMDSLEELKIKIDSFNKERDWDKFHSPANLVKSIVIESSELLECFQWNDDTYKLDDVKEELADVVNYCIQLASVLDLDIKQIVLDKLKKTEEKYPVDKCKGISTKYNKLQEKT